MARTPGFKSTRVVSLPKHSSLKFSDWKEIYDGPERSAIALYINKDHSEDAGTS